MGDGRYLFALIERPGKPDYLETVASASIAGLKGRSATEELFQEVSRQRGRAKGVIVVPDYQWSLMVTFTDITNPTTLQLVNPYNFSETLGAGYALNGSVAKILSMSERVLTIFSETFDERLQVAPFSG